VRSPASLEPRQASLWLGKTLLPEAIEAKFVFSWQ
jgi:hypothetical protein